MLDYDLAEIYEYTTKRFNEQVKNNKSKFPEDFRFQLTKEEWEILRSEKSTSSWGGKRYVPHAFTEEGVYMLMTVLKGEMATKQSIALIRLFKRMKTYYLLEKQGFTEKMLSLMTDKMKQQNEQLRLHEAAIQSIENKMITRTELSDFIKLFNRNLAQDEILLLDGEPFKADLAYQRIYAQAQKSIIMIDDYIDIKTLQHLAVAGQAVTVTIIIDNKGFKPLRQKELNDYLTEYPGRPICFLQSQGRLHDRYIVLDEELAESIQIYHCGASSKDAGKRITTITRLQETEA